MTIQKNQLSQYLKFFSTQPKSSVYNEIDPKTKQNELTQLFKPYKICRRCPLGNQGRINVVFGSGDPNAKLMFIGEGPGRDEDKQGLPFVGRAGKLLTKIINSIGLQRKDVYITNVVKCRPPKNRTPTLEESSTCKSLMLFQQINIIQPSIICTLGASATQAMLGDHIRISKVRGMFQNFDGISIIPTFHPAYLLRNPSAKKLVWDDMQKIMAKLSLEAG